MNTVFLIALALICLAPVWHVICASVSDPVLLSQNNTLLFMPLGKWTFKGYEIALSNLSILKSYGNTLFYVLSGTLMSTFMTSLGAFILSRRDFLLAKPIMVFLTFTILFNGGVIPNYILIQKLHLINSRMAVVLPSLLNVFHLIILRTAFGGIPASLEESAKLDGANDFQIFSQVVVPLSKASVSVITLFTAVSLWNSWFPAMLYLSDRSKYPLQIILREILIENDSVAAAVGMDVSVGLYKTLVKYCTIIIATVPILFVYPFVQKYFVKGVMIGAVKE